MSKEVRESLNKWVLGFYVVSAASKGHILCERVTYYKVLHSFVSSSALSDKKRKSYSCPEDK